ncbi:MAG: hypothetical protein LC779_16430 [Actinobacteria bacterium]|nr:hypothetical protein [Actinomycetota bacterium]
MVELLVAMSIMGVLAALGTPTWLNYKANQDVVSATRQVVGVLRNAQVHAVAEEQTYRVDLDAGAGALTVRRFDGSTYVLQQTVRLGSGAARLSAPVFTSTSGTSSSAYFYPRGTASPGSVRLTRTGRTAVHMVTIEGLTGRVSYN